MNVYHNGVVDKFPVQYDQDDAVVDIELRVKFEL